ncbi:MAG: HpcH/HpaI aldolase/citrate lyase family protein [Actinomycetes bacterium]
MATDSIPHVQGRHPSPSRRMTARDRGPGSMALRTLLFVPGDRPDRIAKAFASPADGVAVDLEDAVAESAKSTARAQATGALSAGRPGGCIAAVRINAVDSGHAEDDLTALTPVLPLLDTVLVPKVSSPDEVRWVAARLDHAEAAEATTRPVRLVPIVETAAGVLAAAALAAAHPRVHTLSFGSADLGAELGITPTADGSELRYARSHVVLAAAAAARAKPLDAPYLDLSDPDGLLRAARQARALGFGGMQVIHPAQLEPVRATFTPTTDEIAWANEVDSAFRAAEAAGVSSIRLDDGSFVDYPVARRAREVLAAAEAGPSSGGAS